jgi:SH3-like domain-containing protein
MTRTPRLAAALAVALAGCGKSSSPPPAAGEWAPAAESAPAAPTAAHVSSATSLRREPLDAPRVKGPTGKDVSNTLAVLQRGEQVALLEVRDEWARVRSSDDREGWLKRAAILEGDEVAEATVLVPADVFDRPDLLAANARRKIEAGTLLLVVKARAPFSEVNVSSGPNAWVLAERLATGEKEVSVAKLTEKARWLVRSGKPEEARRILALAREHFAGVALVDALAVELGEAPAAEAAVVPASAPVPGDGGG